MPARKKGAVKRVLRKPDVVKVSLSPEEKQAALKETFDVLNSLKKEEFNLIASLGKPGVDRKAVEQRLMELSKEIESLKKTITEAPSLRSKTFQKALEPQIGSLFVSKPGREGYAEVKRNMNQIQDFINNAKDIITSGRLGPETRKSLSKMISEYEKQLEILREYEKKYLKRKGLR